jgi:hypothetical protein
MFTAYRRVFFHIDPLIMSTNNDISPNLPKGPRKYHRITPINTWPTPTIPVPASQEGYTLLSPITLRESLKTSQLISEIPACHHITTNTHSILPTPPPSAQCIKSFNVSPAPGDCQLRSASISAEQKLERSLRSIDRLLKDLPSVYEIESIGELLYLLFYLPDKEDYISRKVSSTHIFFHSGRLRCSGSTKMTSYSKLWICFRRHILFRLASATASEVHAIALRLSFESLETYGPVKR